MVGLICIVVVVGLIYYKFYPQFDFIYINGRKHLIVWYWEQYSSSNKYRNYNNGSNVNNYKILI